ncbi:MAG: hypothetical protein WAJ87_09865 [Bryobacteraceae bacterium]
MALASRKLPIVLTAAVLFMALLWLLGFGFGHEQRLSRWLGHPFLGSTVYFGTWVVFVGTLVFGLGIPYIVAHFVLHQPLRDFGFSLGETSQGATWLLLLIPVYLLAPLGSAFIGSESYYTYLVEPGFLTPGHVALHLVSYAMFAFGFEGLFRGFLLFGLVQALGGSRGAQWAAVLLTTALSACCLAGLPWIFAVSALLAGVPAGFLNLRLRSFVYFAFIHWSVGIWSDVWEILKLNVAHRMW